MITKCSERPDSTLEAAGRANVWDAIAARNDIYARSSWRALRTSREWHLRREPIDIQGPGHAMNMPLRPR
jgi:hypothetical protein